MAALSCLLLTSRLSIASGLIEKVDGRLAAWRLWELLRRNELRVNELRRLLHGVADSLYPG